MLYFADKFLKIFTYYFKSEAILVFLGIYINMVNHFQRLLLTVSIHCPYLNQDAGQTCI